jgi:large subunit ribosomal protein L21
VYAIIEDGGKQYKVQPGDKVDVELRELKPDQTEVVFDRVLYLRDEKNITVGQPVIPDAKVVGKITDHTTGPKLYPMQFRRRKDSRRRIGHRQKYLQVEITDIRNA